MTWVSSPGPQEECSEICVALITFNHSVVTGWLVAMSSQCTFASLCLVLCGSEKVMEDFVSSPRILKLASRSDLTHIQHLNIQGMGPLSGSEG